LGKESVETGALFGGLVELTWWRWREIVKVLYAKSLPPKAKYRNVRCIIGTLGDVNLSRREAKITLEGEEKGEPEPSIINH